MNRLPIYLKLRNKPCLVVGGGVVAARKVRLLLRTGAKVTVVSPEFGADIEEQESKQSIAVIRSDYRVGLLEGYGLVIAATSDARLNRRIAADADAAGILCNAVDDNEASEFILPAIVDRSPVVVAIGTEGTAPVLAQQLKSRIEAVLPARIALLATQAGRWRDLVKKRFAELAERRRFWQGFFDGPIGGHLLAGRQTAAERLMRQALLRDAGSEQKLRGEAWIVGAGPGDPGLLTLRAHQLISRADVILYDRLVSSEILDHARKEVDLIFVGKRAGHAVMSQDEINRLLVRLVREGKRVCRLKGGDPFVFGRGGEEALVLSRAGLTYEIVPGISAALGCAAYAGIPLTHRGISAGVILTTATLDKNKEPDWSQLAQLLRSGNTLALYMGVAQLGNLSRNLLSHGVAADTPAAIVENGTTGRQRTVLTTLDVMPDDAANAGIAPPSMLFIGATVGLSEELQWFDGNSPVVRAPTSASASSYSC